MSFGTISVQENALWVNKCPSHLPEVMSQLFSGKEWEFVTVYLDDVLIVSQNITEHLEHVKKVLDCV